MSRRTMDSLKDMLCMELDEISEKGELNAGDLETVHKLTDTIKNIDKIEMYDGGYSRDGDWRATGSYSRMRDGYGRREDYNDSYGRHYVRGHYSRGTGRETIVDNIREMMSDESLSAAEKNALKKAMDSFQ